MSDAVVLIGGCAVVTATIKAVGPVALGGRVLPAWINRVIVLLAPALLTALVVTQALSHGHRLTVGANTIGVLAGGAVAWKTGSIIGCLVAAAGVTAFLRAIT